MWRASRTLFSHLSRRHNPALSRAYITHLSSRPRTCNNKTPHGLPLSPPQFRRHLDSLAPDVPDTSSPRQRSLKLRSHLEETFESAKTLEEMLAAFKDMEEVFDQRDVDLGLASLKVGLKMDREGEDPQKTLSFAEKALRAFDTDDGKPSLPLAMTLQLLGSACSRLKRFNDGLGYLNRANKVLGRLEGEGHNPGGVLPVLHTVHLELASVKMAMGRREEAIGNLKASLEIKEKTMEKDSKELGTAYRDFADACVAILNFKEALPYCLKALELHKSQLGDNSVEVARDRRSLAVIYTGLEEHHKALEQNGLSQKVLKKWGLNPEVLQAEIDAANMQIALGKYDEAINTLKGVVQQTERESEHRALIFTSMGKALCSLEKFADSKKCLEIACGILDKKEAISPLLVSEAYMEISMQYETMNEFETAISLLKRALSLLGKLPQEQHSEGGVSARIGWLLSLTGKVTEAIPYLESAAQMTKQSFGDKHFGVGYIYNNLGAAYLEIDRPQSAAQVFAFAKDVLDVSLGPHHVDSIDVCQNLSKAYDALGNHSIAISFQQEAVDAFASHGPSAEDDLKEARRVLEQLKTKARARRTAVNNQTPHGEAMPLPHSKHSPAA